MIQVGRRGLDVHVTVEDIHAAVVAWVRANVDADGGAPGGIELSGFELDLISNQDPQLQFLMKTDPVDGNHQEVSGIQLIWRMP